MSIDVEYAIKKDIRNNPVIREVDVEQKRDLLRTAGFAGLALAMLLFSAWQQFKIVQHGYDVEDLRELIAEEEAAQRQLRLEVGMATRPQLLEERAGAELGLVRPSADDILIIERVPSSRPAGAIVAEAR